MRASKKRVKQAFRGQSAVEAMMIMGVVLLFSIPLVLFFYSSMAGKMVLLDQMQAKVMTQRISDTAGEVWFEGKGARRSIMVSVPDHLKSIEFEGKDSVDMDAPPSGIERHFKRNIVLRIDNRIGGTTDMIGQSPAPMESYLDYSDYQNLSRDLNKDGYVDPGLAVIIIKNEGDYVNIVRFVPDVEY